MTSRASKARATKARKQAAALADLGYKTPKRRRRRRPLTEEQKQAARERLAKARAAKAAKRKGMQEASIPYGVDPSVAALPDDNELSLKNVRSWIKHNQQILRTLSANSSERRERMQYQVIDTFITNLKTYIRTGVYLDHRWGIDHDKPMMQRCLHMAYDANGNVKRQRGVWYPDIGLWEGQ